jgi:hypothetical protein
MHQLAGEKVAEDDQQRQTARRTDELLSVGLHAKPATQRSNVSNVLKESPRSPAVCG